MGTIDQQPGSGRQRSVCVSSIQSASLHNSPPALFISLIT